MNLKKDTRKIRKEKIEKYLKKNIGKYLANDARKN